MEKNKKFSRTKALKEVGVSYLGATKQSAKLIYSYNNGVETYGVYLAPATLAKDEKHNINTCPCSEMCADACLSRAGRNKIEKFAIGADSLSKIDKARIKKTHLFYDDREKFMQILISEIKSAKERAEKNGKGFAIRLNCTSDLSPEVFKLNGKNILEIFPDVQFYDYTKVVTRLNLINKYPNYYLVFSHSGDNWNVCQQALANGINVAMVFDLTDANGKQTLPETYKGYEVIDGNESDIRYVEPRGVIVGLHYHRTAKDYKGGKYDPVQTPFVIREN